MNTINILAIESSCDDTAAAVISDGKVISNIISTQLIHKEYGGVVPELASRAHQKNIIPAVEVALKRAKLKKEELKAIAFTRGPGLLGSLLVGASFAKSLAWALNIPLIGVHHLEAHLMSHFIEDPKPSFPFLCLLVSGGHTAIYLLKGVNQFEKVGETMDDAAGEALDKGAKMLGLDYPGGPLIDKLAKNGNSEAFQFPHPATRGFSYSFSGLKTSLLYFLRDRIKEDPAFIEKNLNDICASYQKAVIEYLLSKLKKAAEKYGVKEIGIAGGVSANSYLRKRISEEGEKRAWNTYVPDFEYCTDNAAMIAIAGHYRYLVSDFDALDIRPLPRWEAYQKAV